MPPVEGLDVYFELSYATLVLVPSGDWAPLDPLITRERQLHAMRLSGSRMLAHELVGGLALRRGDLRRAAEPLETLRALALAAGEPQRILPMASVVMPYALLSGDRETVRELAESVLASTDREWAQLTTTAIPRVLAAAGETALLRRLATAFSQRRSNAEAPRTALSLAVTDGLLSLAEGRADDAVDQLEWALGRERSCGWHYRAACLELDLARALEAARRPDDARSARERAAAVLEPLGCVNPV